MNPKRKSFASKKFLFLSQFIIKEIFRRAMLQSGQKLKGNIFTWLFAAEWVADYLMQQELQDPEEIMG